MEVKLKREHLPIVNPVSLSFSYQYRSPFFSTWNWWAIIQANVGPSTAPSIEFSEMPPTNRSMSSGCLKEKRGFSSLRNTRIYVLLVISNPIKWRPSSFIKLFERKVKWRVHYYLYILLQMIFIKSSHLQINSNPGRDQQLNRVYGNWNMNIFAVHMAHRHVIFSEFLSKLHSNQFISNYIFDSYA